MKKLSWIWLFLLCLSGAGAGSALLQGMGEAASQGSPQGWTRLEAKVPFRRSDLLGSLPPTGAAYSLDHFQGLVADSPSQTWSLELNLGDAGEARVALFGQIPRQMPGQAPSTAGNQLLGDGLFLSRADGGRAEALAFGRGKQVPLQCEGSLPKPTQSIYPLTIRKSPEGFVAESSSGSSTGSLRCRSSSDRGQPVLMSGLERIHVLSSRTDSSVFTTPFLPAPGPLGALAGVVLVLALWRLERRLGADGRIAALTTSPLLLSWPLHSADRMQIVENMRMPGLSETSLAVAIPSALAVFFKLIHHAGRRSRGAHSNKRAIGEAALLMSAGSAVISVASGPHWPMATVYFALAGGFLGVLVAINANARRLRAVNLFSLILIALSLLSAEWGIRWTQTGLTWTPTGRMNHDMQLGWTRSTLSDFQALDAAQTTNYPSSGYPVSIAPDASLPRWICLGSSATGGAFQNDNLDDFYPARIAELLQNEAQVLNQGVGGWTSFHVARYVEREADALRPDIVSVYLGHNDILTRSTRPYRDLYAHWKEHGAPATPLPTVRLFQGFRFFLGSLLQTASSTAVPVDHAQENFTAIHEVTRAHGAKLLLIPEAITPSSASLKDYDRMLRDFAESHADVAYFDAPRLLLNSGGDHFLDDVHLSDTGHRLLAGALVETIRELGWLSDSQ